jgi:very-short-patch-repair endonuclease
LRGRDILSGQAIHPAIALRAQQLRHQMTAAEQMLWHALRANRLRSFHFRRQQVVGGFIVDFYCHAAHLVVEVDGGIHLSQVEADRERDAILTGLGLAVLRVTNEDVFRDLEPVLDRISSLLPAFPRWQAREVQSESERSLHSLRGAASNETPQHPS